MTRFRSATVFFGTDRDENARLNDTERVRALQEGMSAICAEVQGIRIVTVHPIACAVSVAGPPAAIDRLKKFVDARRLGEVDLGAFEKPALRAASNRS